MWSSSSLIIIALLHVLPVLAATIVSTVTLTGSASTPTVTSTSYTDDKTFKNDMLVAHNFYRAEHGAVALVWNDTSARYAADWSKACVFEHSGGPTGENLVAGASNATTSIDAWGLERTSYDWNKPGFQEATGHFTQLVWKNTTSVGCGRTSCQGKNQTPGWYVVCEYFPAGNVVGSNGQYFQDNVARISQGKLTDTVEAGVNGKGANPTAASGSATGTATGTAASGTSTGKSGASNALGEVNTRIVVGVAAVAGLVIGL
ncbi:CAP domain-containing protein [Tricladium varicosporioides]|nr:CAP domain-containing protein [Hymenoscyphus varicosporioides]